MSILDTENTLADAQLFLKYNAATLYLKATFHPILRLLVVFVALNSDEFLLKWNGLANWRKMNVLADEVMVAFHVLANEINGLNNIALITQGSLFVAFLTRTKCTVFSIKKKAQSEL